MLKEKKKKKKNAYRDVSALFGTTWGKFNVTAQMYEEHHSHHTNGKTGNERP